MRSRPVVVVALAMLWVLALHAPANAYIDAGSTSVVFQAVIAFLAAAGVTLKMTWSRISQMFRRNRETHESELTEAGQGAEE